MPRLRTSHHRSSVDRAASCLFILLFSLLLPHLLHLLHGHVMFIRLRDLLALARELGLPLAFSCLRFFEAVGFMMVDFLGARLVI
jgi:hypothetical protein